MASRRTTALIAGAGVVAIGAGAFALFGNSTPEPKQAAAQFETVAAARGALTERVEVKGTLAFGEAKEYGTQMPGTVTSLAAIGSHVANGGELMRVDDSPVSLLHGTLPVWRAFEPGMDNGRDVLQLEQALKSLGHFGFEPDEVFDWNTSSAIGNWQKGLGFTWDTQIPLGRVAFAPSDVRVTSHLVKPGAAASLAALTASGTTKLVTADVAPEMRDLLPVGQEATLTLPDGTQTTATVQSVGAPVEKQDAAGKKALKVPVALTLTDSAAAEQYSDVSVSISVARTIQEDALTVPVRALLAEPGGKYAVDVSRGGAVTRVPIEVGSFADGAVQVTGGKLNAGDKVVVGE